MVNYKKKAKAKINIQKKTRKKYERKPKKRKYNKKKEIKKRNLKVVLLPEELLLKAEKISEDKTSLLNLGKAIEIYDINDDINYNYLNLFGKITEENYKYIYTLSYANRKKIIKQYNIGKKIFNKSSKIIFYEFVNFIINKLNIKDKKPIKQLNDYKLEYFENFIIPINEGTEELKFFYFINIIFNWMKLDVENGRLRLLFFKDFFSNKENLNKIEHIFYIILRINLLYLKSRFYNNYSLIYVNLMVNEQISHKIQGLKLIKEEIKENIDKIKIDNNTVLTLKKNKFKFKPFDYYYYFPFLEHEEDASDYILDKIRMTFDYCQRNRFSIFDNDLKIKAFYNIIKKILSSRVIKEYYEKNESFKNYEFPFKDEKIINYIWEKIIFIELDRFHWGYSAKEGFGFFLNRIKGSESKGLTYGCLLITFIKEVINHYLKKLINANEGIRQESNSVENSLIDVDEKIENEIFGRKVNIITYGGNHFLFEMANWDLPLKLFRKRFLNNNVMKKEKKLRDGLKYLKEDENVGKIFENINYEYISEKELIFQAIPYDPRYCIPNSNFVA